MMSLKQGRTFAIHPLPKLAVLSLTVFIVLTSPGLEGQAVPYLLWLALLLIVWIVVGISSRALWQAVRVTALLGSILIVTQGFLYRSGGTDTPLFVLFGGDLAGRQIGVFTLKGAIAGAIGTLKLLMILVSSQVVATSTPGDLAAALEGLGLPRTATFTVSSGVRFIPLVRKTYLDVIDARRLRGIDRERLEWWRRLTSFYPQLMIPLVLSLFRIGLQTQITLYGRGFFRVGRRTPYNAPPFRLTDAIVLALLVILFGLELHVIW